MTGGDRTFSRAGCVLPALVFCAQPLLEIYRTLFGSRVQIGPVALEEAFLLLTSFAALLSGCAAAVKTGRKKALRIVLISLALLTAFTVLNGWWAAGFNAALLPGAKPDFLVEVYGVLRLYLAPLALLGGLFLLAPDEKTIVLSLKITACLFAAVVVLCGLFGWGFAAYRDGNTAPDGGFFAWFTLPADAEKAGYTNKGLFSSGNDVGTVLLVLSPFVCRAAFDRERRFSDLGAVFLTGLASVMIGTKVAAAGFFFVFLLTLAFFLADAAREKALRPALKRALPAALTGFILAVLFIASPGLRMQWERVKAGGETDRRPDASLAAVLAEPEGESALLAAYIEEHGWDHHINAWFTTLYPVEGDPLFWREVLRRDSQQNADNRAFKTEMIDRIIARDGRKGDFLLGIGRTSGVPYSEKDLVYQAQVYGILGAVLLLAPFAASLVCAVFAFFVRLRSHREAGAAFAPVLSLSCAFGAAALAGHVFDTPLSTYVLTGPAALAFLFAAKKETKR